MITKIRNPRARANLVWVPAEEGGRLSGPPAAATYAATTVISPKAGLALPVDWFGSAEMISIIIGRVAEDPTFSEAVEVDFLVPELAEKWLHPGVRFMVTEGSKIVANGVMTEIFDR